MHGMVTAKGGAWKMGEEGREEGRFNGRYKESLERNVSFWAVSSIRTEWIKAEVIALRGRV